MQISRRTPRRFQAAFVMALTLTAGLTLPSSAEVVKAVSASEFLNSIGANSAINMRGEQLNKTVECARYLGLRWFRSGIEGNPNLKDLLELHRLTGVRYSWCPGSGGTDLQKLLSSGKVLAEAGALLAFEGPNEPNNWGVTYKDLPGGRDKSWKSVAQFQSDMYQGVKSDPVLKSIPVWGISECGAETDNVGLQFLKIPAGANTVLPEGTQYSDYANVHNYVYHPNSPKVEDNKTWRASDPSSACRVDGLFGEYGVTWAKHFKGYSETELSTLPRVTTETGSTIEGDVTEEVHALNLMSLYLDQFKRGWSYTAVYLMRDRSDEAGNQKFGFYAPDYTPRKAAIYLHNLTSILADTATLKRPGSLEYSVDNCPETVHHMLLQKSNFRFELVIWSELVKGANNVTVQFGKKLPTLVQYDPTIGSDPVTTTHNSDSLSLSLTNHPIVIEIRFQ